MIKLYLAIFFAGLLFAGLCGCHKEAVAIPANLQNAALTGKWYLRYSDLQISTDTSLSVTDSANSSFGTDDYFEFKADNSAIYSSTKLAKRYDGYYAANSSVLPQTLTFKSGNFIDKYILSKLSKDSLMIYQTQSTVAANVTTTRATYYIYTH